MKTYLRRQIANTLWYIFFCQICFQLKPLCSQTRWEPLGPFGGLVNFLVSDGKEWVYAGIEGSGVYRSSDEGRKWIPANNGLPGNEVYSFCIAPDGRIFCAGDKLLAVSSDHGDHWSTVPTIPSNDFFTSVCVLADSQIFLASAFSNIAKRSMDNGVSWQSITGIPPWGGEILRIGPGSDSTALAGTDGQGLFQIQPHADTVALVMYNLPETTVGPFPYGPSSQFVIRNDGTILFMYSYVLRALPFNTLQWNKKSKATGNESLYLSADSILYAYGTVRIMVSSDFGNTWGELPKSDQVWWAKCFTKTNNSFLSAGRMGGGFWRSDDTGKTWNASNNGIARNDVNCILATSQNTLILGTEHGGLIRSTDLGVNWMNVTLPPPGSSNSKIISVRMDSKNTLYAASMGATNSIWRSTTDGESWTQTSFNDSDLTLGVSLTLTDMYINASDKIFVSGFSRNQDSLSGVFTSTDEGSTWHRLFSVPPNSSAQSFLLLDDSTILMGTYVHGFFRSSDIGLSWEQVEGTGGFQNIVSIIQDSAGIILAASLQGGVVRSTDFGMTWSFSNTGLLSTEVRTISKLPNGILFAGTNRGGFVSKDHGVTWAEVTSSIQAGEVRSLFVDSYGVIFIVTEAGLYKTSSITSSGFTAYPAILSEWSLSQNYPNPFNPGTAIHFSITKAAHVTMVVHNLIGQKVATLVDQSYSPGIFTARWDGKDDKGNPVSAGLYFYTMTAGGYSNTKKMILLK